jgi:methanogenic corrinoid protein MtbC1
MKGEIFERTKHIVLNIDEHAVGIASEVLDDEFVIEIAWEAINLVELYIIMRIVEQMLLIAEYMLLEVRTSPIHLIEPRYGQGMELIGGFFEKGEFQLRQIFREYSIFETEINVLKSVMTGSMNEISSYNNLFMEPGRISAYPSVSHLVEALPYACCC